MISVITSSIFSDLKKGTSQKAKCMTNCYGQVRAGVHKNKSRKAKTENGRASSKSHSQNTSMYLVSVN